MLRNQNILRFQVSVDNFPIVKMLECSGQLVDDGLSIGGVQPFLFDEMTEVAIWHVFQEYAGVIF